MHTHKWICIHTYTYRTNISASCGQHHVGLVNVSIHSEQAHSVNTYTHIIQTNTTQTAAQVAGARDIVYVYMYMYWTSTFCKHIHTYNTNIYETNSSGSSGARDIVHIIHTHTKQTAAQVAEAHDIVYVYMYMYQTSTFCIHTYTYRTNSSASCGRPRHCMCIYTCTYIHTYEYIYIHTHKWIYNTYIHTNVYSYIHAHTEQTVAQVAGAHDIVCVHIHIHTYTRIYI